MKPRFLLQRSQRFMWAFLRMWHPRSVQVEEWKDKQRCGGKDNRFDRSINRYRSFLPINLLSD